MGEDSTSNGIGPIVMEVGKSSIAAEKGAAAPTMPKLAAGAGDSSLAPSQFPVLVATAPNH